MTSDLMLAIKTIIIVSPNWRKVLKLFSQTEVRCAAIDSASLGIIEQNEAWQPFVDPFVDQNLSLALRNKVHFG